MKRIPKTIILIVTLLVLVGLLTVIKPDVKLGTTITSVVNTPSNQIANLTKANTWNLTQTLLSNLIVNGLVGIGTSTPYAKLSVVGQTVSEYFTATSTTATSDFAGRIGIATSSPFALLGVSNSLGSTQSFSAGTGTSTFQIASDGTVRLTGDATTWEDLRFPATAINPAGATAAMVFDTTNIGFTASASGTTSIAVIAQMPHSWKQGSTIEPHIHWEPTTTDTGNVVWNITYRWVNINEDEPIATFSQVIDAGDGSAFRHQLADFPGIAGTGKTFSSLLSITISRGGSSPDDTYTGDALLKEFDIHYEVDSFGTDSEYGKR
jgi:hypothetical protein